MWEYLKYLLQVVIRPARGWEDLEEAAPVPATMSERGLYPLIGLASVCTFLDKVYHPTTTLPQLLTGAIVQFVALFAAFFITRFALLTIFPALREERVTLFAAILTGYLALAALIANSVPMTLAIMLLLPIYGIAIAWSARTYLDVPRTLTGKFVLTTIFGGILPPYVISYLFHLILPR